MIMYDNDTNETVWAGPSRGEGFWRRKIFEPHLFLVDHALHCTGKTLLLERDAISYKLLKQFIDGKCFNLVCRDLDGNASSGLAGLELFLAEESLKQREIRHIYLSGPLKTPGRW